MQRKSGLWVLTGLSFWQHEIFSSSIISGCSEIPSFKQQDKKGPEVSFRLEASSTWLSNAREFSCILFLFPLPLVSLSTMYGPTLTSRQLTISN
jgi:hypothetical protein